MWRVELAVIDSPQLFAVKKRTQVSKRARFRSHTGRWLSLHLRGMKRRTASLIGLLLYLTVQVVAAMPVQWRMDCLTSGRAALSWGSSRSCGQQERPDSGTSVDVQCCVYSHVLASRDAQVKGDVPLVCPPADALPVPSVYLAPTLDPCVRTTLYEQPPPDSGRSLVRLRSLRL